MQPERLPWEITGAGVGPFLSVREVTVQTLRQDRYLVACPDGEQTVQGFDRARELAHELCGELG